MRKAIALLLCQAKGTQSANAIKTMCPNLRKTVRSIIIIIAQRGHDQLVDILLMG